MALRPGTRLGPYEIVAPLGAGGMGEVYRARDTRLGRDVAVKVLPQHVAAGPEDRARFSREAKTISSLNHPHICTLHDIGREGDTDYLVMEMVEGETLANRISRGPLPTADVLRIGVQIADALDRAHRAGVVHRDLKPGNVMLTKVGAKLMDFGLARESRPVGLGPDAATATEPGAAHPPDESITKKGMIVGTFQYMAPEQLEGKRADARSDLWALGCVLYEMATGKRAFEGATPVSVISAIMRGEPRVMTELAPLTPPAFERAVKQCLAKEPDDRWQSAGDLRRELTWISESGSQAGVPAPVTARRKSRERLAWALFVIVGAILAATLSRPKHAPKSVVFELATPPEMGFVDLPRISPDGTTLAFHATDTTGVSSIFIRPLSSLAARRLPGTEGALRPFWSPDSRSLAYFVGGKLMRMDIGGGPPVALCEVAQGGDGTWSSRGVILFDQTTNDSIEMVSASGGIPTGATRLDRSKRETGSCWPEFLPDGRHFLYLAYAQGADSAMLKVGSIDSKSTVTLGPARSRVEFASGNLLYVTGGTLVARPFDAQALRFTGQPIGIAQNVGANDGGGADYSASAEGSLVYHTGSSDPGERFVWVNRRGDRIGTTGGLGDYYDTASLSPDGTRLAASVGNSSRSSREIRVWDLARGTVSRLTFSDQDMISPTWSPDGSRVAFGMKHGNGYDLYVKALGARSEESILYSSDENKFPDDWSADGRWLVYTSARDSRSDLDIYALSLTGPATSRPIVSTKFWDSYAALSPDGKWLAYASREVDHWEVYVTAFGTQSDTWRVSTNGGIRPSWRRDGRELYYLASDGGMMAVPVSPGPIPRFSRPAKLFDTRINVPFIIRASYVPTSDGQKFLLIRAEERPRPGPTTVMLHWPGMVARH